MSIHEEITQGVRAWIRAGLGLPTEKVLPFDAQFSKDFKGALPFLTVRILAMPQIGRNEILQAYDSDEPDSALAVKGYSRAPHRVNVEIQGYGLGAYDWMLEMQKMEESIAAQDALDANFLSVSLIEEPTDLSEFLETDMEMRFVMNVEFGITISGNKYAAIPLEAVDINMELQKTPLDEIDPDLLDVNVDIDFE